MSVSGHKIHGPKGVGFLICGREGEDQAHHLRRRPAEGHALGDRKRSGLRRSGHGGQGDLYRTMSERMERLYALKDRHGPGAFQRWRALRSTDVPARDSAPRRSSAPGFEGVRAEVLLHALEDKGIYVSSGSACSSNHPGVSGTLKRDRSQGIPAGFHPAFLLWRVQHGGRGGLLSGGPAGAPSGAPQIPEGLRARRTENQIYRTEGEI